MTRARDVVYPEGWNRDLITDFWGSLGHKWGCGVDIGDGKVRVDLVAVAQRFLSTEPRPESVTRWISGIPEGELREVACFIVLRAGSKA